MFTGIVLFLADLFKREQSFKLYRAFRTKRTAFSAAYTFRAVGIFQNFNLHRANTLAPMTSSAFAFVNLCPEKAETVENTVNRTKRAKVLAERPLDEHTKQENSNENENLPSEQSADSRTKAFVSGKKRKTALKRAGRADPLAEIR